jgi:hypothetical protein
VYASYTGHPPPDASIVEAIMRTRIVQCVLLSSSLFLLFSPGAGQAVAAAAALPAYSGCQAPASEGVKICVPSINNGVIGSPFQLIASATSGRGEVVTMELWADGKKVTQTDRTPFDEPITLPEGTHTLTVIEVSTTGAFVKSAPLTVTVENRGDTTCTLPAGPGVKVCQPVQGTCHTAPWVQVLAAAKGQSGTVNRMELWVNGGKIANFPGNHINTNLVIQDFDTVTIYEVDSKGGFIKAPSIVVQSC